MFLRQFSHLLRFWVAVFRSPQSPQSRCVSPPSKQLGNTWYEALILWGSLGHFRTLGHCVLELHLHILITLALNTPQWLHSGFHCLSWTRLRAKLPSSELNWATAMDLFGPWARQWPEQRKPQKQRIEKTMASGSWQLCCSLFCFIDYAVYQAISM